MIFIINGKITLTALLPNRHWPIYFIWLHLALLLGCNEPQLNSERIEQQFGSYGVEILESSASHRVTNLYSLEGDRKVCRTLALVLFNEPMNTAVKAEHQKITAGGSIGAVFKANDWTIGKVNLFLGDIDVAADASLVNELMGISVPNKLAMHIYRFKLQKGQTLVEYATIVEIHHPQYLSSRRLDRLYADYPAEVIPEPALEAIAARVQQLLQQ